MEEDLLRMYEPLGLIPRIEGKKKSHVVFLSFPIPDSVFSLKK